MGRVFMDASPEMKLLLGGLLLAALAAVGLWGAALLRRRAAGQGTLVFLSALGRAGPLLGLAGGAYVLVNGMMALAKFQPPSPLIVMAPGLAEALLSVLLGLLAGAAAVLAHAHLAVRAARPAVA